MISFFRCPRRLARPCAAIGLAALAGGAQAEDLKLLPDVFGANELYAADRETGTALFGYDPVSYAVGSGPRLGAVSYEVIRNGLVWRFASEANRTAFLHDPDFFLPRLGGYDAVAAAAGTIVRSDPQIYAVVANRTYFFRTAANRDRFLADGSIRAAAEARWPELRTGLVRG